MKGRLNMNNNMNLVSLFSLTVQCSLELIYGASPISYIQMILNMPELINLGLDILIQNDLQKEKLLKKQMHSFVVHICDDVRSTLSKKSSTWKNFFNYAELRIQNNNLKTTHWFDIAEILKKDLATEAKWEGIILTQADYTVFIEVFEQAFCKYLGDFKPLSDMIFARTLLNHEKKLEILEKNIQEIIEHLGEQESNKYEIKFKNNKFLDYLEKWNSQLFLHHNSPYDISLKKFYLKPEYNEKNSGKPKERRNNLDEKIDDYLKDSFYPNQCRPTMILADAGMGKTSLVSYICSKVANPNRLVILRFSDFKRITDHHGILEETMDALGCRTQDDLRELHLILDGYDECKILGDANVLLKNFFKICMGIKGLKVMITSRVNYINYSEFNHFRIYFLKYFSKKQIEEVSSNYFRITNKRVRLDGLEGAMEEVIGIPLILYMVLSLQIPIKKKDAVAGLYERIFALEGGIYDRMAYEWGEGYESTAHPMVFEHKKEDMHTISQNLAFKMFELDTLQLSDSIYRQVVIETNKDRLEDFAISNYYYIEDNLRFVHKSIYEYFVSEYMYNLIKSSYDNVNELSSNLALLCPYHIFSAEILTFFNHKVQKCNIMSSQKFYQKFMQCMEQMLENGMTYYLPKRNLKVLEAERLIFCNVMQLWDVFFNASYGKKDYKNLPKVESFMEQLINRNNMSVNLSNISFKNIKWEKNYFLENLNFSYTFWSNVHIDDCIINHADFSNASFITTTIKRAKLKKCKFIKSKLQNVDLGDTDCSDATFSGINYNEGVAHGTNFSNALFRKASVNSVEFKSANFNNADLSYTEFVECDFERADFTLASINNCRFQKCSFRGVAFERSKPSISKDTKFFECTIDDNVTEYMKNRGFDMNNFSIYVTNRRMTISYEEYLKEKARIHKENDTQ